MSLDMVWMIDFIIHVLMYAQALLIKQNLQWLYPSEFSSYMEQYSQPI